MTPLRLTTWFRRRMLPLVLATAIPVAAAAPIAFYVQKRLELVHSARSEAARLAMVVASEIEERPRLWRYDATKLGERLAAEGLDRSPLRLIEAGRDVKVERTHPEVWPQRPLWASAPVRLGAGRDSREVARVWVAVEASPLWTVTASLAALFLLLAIGLGTVLYLLPVRAIAGAERRTHLLLGRLALTLQEEDRRRIARDLHDGAGQALTAARLELLALGARGGDDVAQAVRRIAAQLDEALEEVRRSSAALGPPALQELGFARAVERRCEAFADAARLPVSCSIDALPAVAAEVELAGYRIVQEALTNIARHASATQAWVRIWARGGQLCIEVRDDGKGLAAGHVRGRGLDGIRERTELLGGRFRLDNAAGGGVRLAVDLPLEAVETA